MSGFPLDSAEILKSNERIFLIMELLKNNWTGQDLRGWHVYGSILRPMMGLKIDGTVFLNGNGARYNQYMIYEYVVAREPLDARTREHYTLILSRIRNRVVLNHPSCGIPTW